MYFPDIFSYSLRYLYIPYKYSYCLSETVLIRKRFYLSTSQLKYLTECQAQEKKGKKEQRKGGRERERREGRKEGLNNVFKIFSLSKL